MIHADMVKELADGYATDIKKLSDSQGNPVMLYEFFIEDLESMIEAAIQDYRDKNAC